MNAQLPAMAKVIAAGFLRQVQCGDLANTLCKYIWNFATGHSAVFYVVLDQERGQISLPKEIQMYEQS